MEKLLIQVISKSSNLNSDLLVGTYGIISTMVNLS